MGQPVAATAWNGLITSLMVHMIWLPEDAALQPFVKEYCETETFRARCPRHQLIVMDSARYGRMRFGRCVDRDYGHVGCATSVLGLADRWCSGREQCTIPIPNGAFKSTRPCPKDLKPYFEAGYFCKKVYRPTIDNCLDDEPLEVTQSIGLLTKPTHREKSCPMLVKGQPGQKVNVTLLDFAHSTRTHVPREYGGVCHVYAMIRDLSIVRATRVCAGSKRESMVFASQTHEIEVKIPIAKNTGASEDHFLLRYEITGCADIRVEAERWTKRQGDETIVGCYNSQQTWILRCVESTWTGTLGNCTKILPPDDSGDSGLNLFNEISLGPIVLPVSVSLIAISLIAVVVGILILSLGVGCVRRRRQQQSSPGVKTHLVDGPPPDPYEGMTDVKPEVLEVLKENEYDFIPAHALGLTSRAESPSVTMSTFTSSAPGTPQNDEIYVRRAQISIKRDVDALTLGVKDNGTLPHANGGRRGSLEEGGVAMQNGSASPAVMRNGATLPRLIKYDNNTHNNASKEDYSNGFDQVESYLSEHPNLQWTFGTVRAARADSKHSNDSVGRSTLPRITPSPWDAETRLPPPPPKILSDLHLNGTLNTDSA